jgi:hypothetical protein
MSFDAEVEAGYRAAAEIERSFDIREACAPYAKHAYRPEMAGWPACLLDDYSGIPFLDDIPGVPDYQFRARVRARSGDLVMASSSFQADFEAYCRDRLGLGAPDLLQVTPFGVRVSDLCREGPAMSRLVDHARARGRLVLHPYMGIEAVWRLAEALAEAARVPVGVLAPPPPVTWLANDKARVTEFARLLVEPLLGPAVVETKAVASAPDLASALQDLAGRHAKVALKLTRCASAMGNRLFEPARILATDPASFATELETLLGAMQWSTGDPVLAVGWEEALASPSSQVWIPPFGDGKPRLDGLYEQVLDGPTRVFVGSEPSTLSEDVHRFMSRASIAMAACYQALGWVGRCSFDFIVTQAGTRLVECNGRWGGTSTPMALMDRLFPDGRPPYLARDWVDRRWVGATFSDLAGALGGALYDPSTRRGSYVLYNLGVLPGYGKFDVIAIAPTRAEVHALLADDLPARLER